MKKSIVLIRRPSLEGLVKLSRSSIYAAMSEGKFPRPIRIGKRAVAWKLSEVEEWISTREQGS